MNIRRAISTDWDVLLDVWLRSVRATHHFLSEAEIDSFIPLVREYLASGAEVWVLWSDAGPVMGFMGLAGSKIEALFLAPEFHRQGGGRRLVEHARALGGDDLTVDVNEQNPAAVRFYEACGFVVEGRSDLDSAGRPFPLLHLRLRTPQPSVAIPVGAAPDEP